MSKRYSLLVYRIYFERWGLAALLLFIVSLALFLWSPPQLRDYRSVLFLTAGLGALVLVLGFALATLAFAAVGKQGLVIQLPFWRVRFPFENMTITRIAALEQAAPGQWKDPEVADMSAVVIELKRLPQPLPVLRFWLGRLAHTNAIIVPVKDVMSLRQAVDAGIAKAREERSNV